MKMLLSFRRFIHINMLCGSAGAPIPAHSEIG